jgi:hypothetical protein
MIKIGLDIHGVIDENPRFFSELTKSLIKSGHEVHIITGPSISIGIEEDLKKMDISYTNLFSIIDYHKAKGTPMSKDSMGRIFMDDYLWDRTKGDYCKKHEIDFHFDDSDAYLYFFKTMVGRVFSKNKRTYHIQENSFTELEIKLSFDGKCFSEKVATENLKKFWDKKENQSSFKSYCRPIIVLKDKVEALKENHFVFEYLENLLNSNDLPGFIKNSNFQVEVIVT